MNKNIIIRNTIIYSLLILGYIFLYVVNVEEAIYPSEDVEVKSKVDFVYQQF